MENIFLSTPDLVEMLHLRDGPPELGEGEVAAVPGLEQEEGLQGRGLLTRRHARLEPNLPLLFRHVVR